MKNKKGFTMAELLIVVAIIAVLVAISIPLFSAQLEKARRATDIANARAIEAQLVAMANSGDIVTPTVKAQWVDKPGVWVVVTREGCQPAQYVRSKWGGNKVFFGANPNVAVNGSVKNNDWQQYDPALAEALKNFANLEVKSGGSDSTVSGVAGWDWYIVEVCYDVDADRWISEIMSGENNQGADVSNITKSKNTILTWMNRKTK